MRTPNPPHRSPRHPGHPAVLVLAVIGLVGLPAVAGCESVVITGQRATETRELTLTAVTGSLVVVETFNGPVTVRAGAGDEVRATLEVTGWGGNRAAAEADRANVTTTLEEEAGRVLLRAVYAPNPTSPGNRGASATVTVPAGSELDIGTSNGAVTVDGIGAAVRVVTSNGAVTVVGSSGDTVIATSNGEIRVTGATGTIDARSSNGRATVEASDAVVAVDTSSGEIRFSGSLAPGDSRLATSNGAVQVTLPAGATFALDASTSNGRITVGFPITTSGAASETLVQGRIGDVPEVAIEIETSNGDVTVEPAR